MRIDVSQAARRLAAHDNILILAHAHPDGDTLGSAFALCRMLRALGKKANAACGDTIPPAYNFMLQGLEEEHFEAEYVVAVDTADIKLLGHDMRETYAGKVDLCIDHHGSNTLFAAETLLMEKSASTAEIIALLFVETGVAIDSAAADCLYTGLSTDTGCFRYANTTAASHRLAADLIEAGARTEQLNKVFFETKTKTYAALEKLAIEGMKLFFDGRFAAITITREMMRKSGSNEGEYDRISTLPLQIEGVVIGATLREMSDGSFKVSVRTAPSIDAAKFCSRMGGGGHPGAAGCHLEGPADRALDELKGYVAAELA